MSTQDGTLPRLLIERARAGILTIRRLEMEERRRKDSIECPNAAPLYLPRVEYFLQSRG